MMKLEFDAEQHIYSLNGRIIPSVTQVLKRAGLIGSFYKKGSAEKGTRIHELTEINDLVPGFIPEEPELEGYLKAWEAFKANSGAEIIASEMMIYSEKYLFAGTLDRIIKMNDQLWILDIKSGAKAKWHPLQLAAYSLALAECKELEINQGIVVYIGKDGRYKTEAVGANMGSKKIEFLKLLGENE